MDILKSYWRMEYISTPKDEASDFENPFSKLPNLGNDKKALIVQRGAFNYVVLNKFPYNPGHLLVIPFKEVGELEDLEAEARHELIDLVSHWKVLLAKAMNPSGFNVGFNLGQSAGAGIPKHLHCHIVPRWEGDTNFMPVIGKTRTLPQALESTWESLMKIQNA